MTWESIASVRATASKSNIDINVNIKLQYQTTILRDYAPSHKQQAKKSGERIVVTIIISGVDVVKIDDRRRPSPDVLDFSHTGSNCSSTLFVAGISRTRAVD
jgi:hypothetical protein